MTADDDMTRRLGEVQAVSLADQARESIRSAILDATYAPGERLTIEQLAAELGISRTPVREALKALESDGLVRLLPHRRALVEPLARDELYHRYSIRAMLEGYAAELACRADAARIADKLEANCEQLAALAERADPDEADQTILLCELNQQFHAIIREASRSRTLVRLLLTLRNPLAYALSYWRDTSLRHASVEIHRQIAAAFRSNRPDLAQSLMERHLLDARDHLMAGATTRGTASDPSPAEGGWNGPVTQADRLDVVD